VYIILCSIQYYVLQYIRQSDVKAGITSESMKLLMTNNQEAAINTVSTMCHFFYIPLVYCIYFLYNIDGIGEILIHCLVFSTLWNAV